MPGAAATPRRWSRRRRDRVRGPAVQIWLPVASATESTDLSGFIQVDGLQLQHCWRQTVLGRAELRPPAGCLQKVSTMFCFRFFRDSTLGNLCDKLPFPPSCSFADIMNTCSATLNGLVKTKAGELVPLIWQSCRCGSHQRTPTVMLTPLWSLTSHVSGLFLLASRWATPYPFMKLICASAALRWRCQNYYLKTQWCREKTGSSKCVHIGSTTSAFRNFESVIKYYTIVPWRCLKYCYFLD